MSNDKEVSIEVHSFITIPLETQHEPQASSFQCLEEPSYVEIFKVSCTKRCKYRNRHPKKVFRNKQIGYIRWRSFLLEGYQILKKKEWKGLVRHPCDRGKCGTFFSHTLFLVIFIFLFCYFLSFCFILFLIAIM